MFKDKFLKEQIKRPKSRPKDDEPEATCNKESDTAVIEHFSAVVNVQRLHGDNEENIDRDDQSMKPGAQFFRVLIHHFEEVHQHVDHHNGHHQNIEQPFPVDGDWVVFLNSNQFGQTCIYKDQVDQHHENGKKPDCAEQLKRHVIKFECK